MGVSAFFDAFFVVKHGIIICQKVLISQKTRAVIQTEMCFIAFTMKNRKINLNNSTCTI